MTLRLKRLRACLREFSRLPALADKNRDGVWFSLDRPHHHLFFVSVLLYICILRCIAVKFYKFVCFLLLCAVSRRAVRVSVGVTVPDEDSSLTAETQAYAFNVYLYFSCICSRVVAFANILLFTFNSFLIRDLKVSVTHVVVPVPMREVPADRGTPGNCLV